MLKHDLVGYLETIIRKVDNRQAVWDYAPHRDYAFIRELFAKKSSLLKEIYEFNALPSRYVDSSWHTFFFSFPLPMNRMKHPAMEKKLSQVVLESIQMRGEWFFDFSDPLKRIALVPSETLQRAAYMGGAGLLSGRIRKMIEKPKADLVKKNLGESAYYFALKRAPLIMNVEYEDVDSIDLFGPELADDVLRMGISLLGACFSFAPESLRRRVKLKLPKSYSGLFLHPHSTRDSRKHLYLFRRILLQESGTLCRNLLN
ncbi:MAG: hypothetical protein GF344_06595 [Chitinivibrionales bacterium]|nr:hypothetical protein [Chitinivibrionales bacterium]MBD3356595.1 hypothetical protein [Chitinivibrionales bacterium]